jgi:hypothetical protein
MLLIFKVKKTVHIAADLNAHLEKINCDKKLMLYNRF